MRFLLTYTAVLVAASLEAAREQAAQITATLADENFDVSISPINEHPHRSPDKDADEQFYHLRDVNQTYTNGRTVAHATAFVRKGADGLYAVAIAECDERDQFDRRRGRTVARRKWFQGKVLGRFTDRPDYAAVRAAYENS